MGVKKGGKNRRKKEKKEVKETQMEVREEKGTGHSTFRANNMVQRCSKEKIDFTTAYSVQQDVFSLS